MRPAIGFGLIGILLLGLASGAVAQSWEQAGCQKIWLTPDHWAYGLNVFIDDLRLFFSFDPSPKAKLALEIASKRACEASLMAQAENEAAFQRAQHEHGRMLRLIQDQLPRIPAQAQLELQLMLEQHETGLINLSRGIQRALLAKQLKQLKQIGSISNASLELHGEFIEAFQAIESPFQIPISMLKLHIIRNIQKHRPELPEQMLSQLENITAAKCSRAQDLVDRAQTKLDQVIQEAQLEGYFDKPPVSKLLEGAQKHLQAAKSALAEGDCGRAFGLANAAFRLAENAERFMEKIEIPKQIKLEIGIQDNTSKIWVRIGSMEYEYKLETADLKQILEFVLEQLELSPDQLELLRIAPVIICIPGLAPELIHVRHRVNLSLQGQQITLTPMVVHGCPEHLMLPLESKLKIKHREQFERRIQDLSRRWWEQLAKLPQERWEQLKQQLEQQEEIIQEYLDQGMFEQAQQLIQQLEQNITQARIPQLPRLPEILRKRIPAPIPTPVPASAPAPIPTLVNITWPREALRRFIGG